MPDINIYIDSSFYEASNSGVDDTYIDYSVEEADNIGERNIPISSVFNSPSDGFQYFSIDYFTPTSGTAFRNTPITYEAPQSTISGVVTSLVDYSLPVTISGLVDEVDVGLNYFARITGVSGEQNARVDSTIGDPYVYSDNIINHYWIFPLTSGALDYDAFYTTVSVTPITADYDTYFSAGSQNTLVSGSVRAFIDSRFRGLVYHFKPDELSYRFDSVCGLETVSQGYDFDSTAISGTVTAINYNVYSTAVVSGIINEIDVCCGLVDLVSYSWESEVIPGGLDYQNWDAYCGVVNTNGFNFDVDLFSLKISNFSLAEGEYSSASGTICVDVTDDIYNVVTSGTYFIIDETVASGVFTPITDGYRMCYDPIDNFASILGATTLTVHAQNDNGDILERDFYVTSGYSVEYDNEIQDYGFGSTVVVRMTAENFASCPLTNVDAYWFTTVQKVTKDLTATIMGVPLSESDLSASIIPQTDTIFFYGKVFTVEIRAKDFAGNKMTPYTFEFRIEDEPE